MGESCCSPRRQKASQESINQSINNVVMWDAAAAAAAAVEGDRLTDVERNIASHVSKLLCKLN